MTGQHIARICAKFSVSDSFQSSVNNCTEGGARRRLKLDLHSRGFNGDDVEIDILMRGSGLVYGRNSLIYRNGQLQEKRRMPEDKIWPGWA